MTRWQYALQKKCGHTRTGWVYTTPTQEPQEVKMEILVNLSPEPKNLADTEAMRCFSGQELLHTISQGSAEHRRSNLMPPWGYPLNERQIRCLVVYLRTLGGSK